MPGYCVSMMIIRWVVVVELDDVNVCLINEKGQKGGSNWVRGELINDDFTRISWVGGRPAPPRALWAFKARDQSRTVAAVAEKLCLSRREKSRCKQCSCGAAKRQNCRILTATGMILADIKLSWGSRNHQLNHTKRFTRKRRLKNLLVRPTKTL